VTTKLYWFPLSHPAQAARRALQLKGIEFESVNVMPGTQRIHLRLVGFREGTVPAIKLDGRRVQGSLRITRELEQLALDPPPFPHDPELRARVVSAEVHDRPSAAAARDLFPAFSADAPRFLPPAWG
jgi:glutathione S-transferase